MNIQYLKAILSGFLITAFLIFILLFFAPLLMGITISEAVAIKAIESYSAIVITAAGSIGTAMLCVAVLAAITACFWGFFRVLKTQQEAPQIYDITHSLPSPERRYLGSESVKGRHNPVLKTGVKQ